MTKEEIKALVASKIEGQGTNLDAASVLPTILNWIIDNVGGDNPLANSFVDVGEVQDGTIREIDDETSVKLTTKALLIKSGNSYFARTSDFLIGLVPVGEYIDETYGNVTSVNCCFGSAFWDPNDPQTLAGADFIFSVDYEVEDTRKHGLISFVI